MNTKTSSAHLKALAREKLLGHYGPAVGSVAVVFVLSVSLHLSVSMFMDTTSPFGMILYSIMSLLLALVEGLFSVSLCFMFLKLHCNQPIFVSDIFYGFRAGSGKAATLAFVLSVIPEVIMLPGIILSSLYTYSLNTVYLMTACICLAVCGIIATVFQLVYSQIYYIMLDFPNYSVKQILSASARIMKGNKGRLFYIQISFIPLILLGILSCGIGFLWIMPYMQSTLAAFYLDVMRS